MGNRKAGARGKGEETLGVQCSALSVSLPVRFHAHHDSRHPDVLAAGRELNGFQMLLALQTVEPAQSGLTPPPGGQGNRSIRPNNNIRIYANTGGFQCFHSLLRLS
jgi:hypothetical protein